MPEIELDDAPLEEVIELLRNQHKINIFVDWGRLLHLADVDRESPVTLDPLSNVPLEALLGLVLRSLEGDPDNTNKLHFHVEGNVLVITAQERPPVPPPPPVEEILERLADERPELHERLMRLREENPERFRDELSDLARDRAVFQYLRHHEEEGEIDEEQERREMEELRERHPEQFKLIERDEELTETTVELAEEIRGAEEGDERNELKGKLRDLLNEQFDVRMAIRRFEAKELQRHLKELTAALERRAKNKAALIERRMTELLDPEETEW
jgi:hypothetical protein